MTVSSQVSEVRFVANGTTKTFAWTNMLVLNRAHLEVWVQPDGTGPFTQLPPTLYEISGTVPGMSGTLTYPKGDASPLSAGSVVKVRRMLPLRQELDLPRAGLPYADPIETTLDQGILIDQQLQRQINEILERLADLEGGSPPPPPDMPTNYVMAFRDLMHLSLTEVPATVTRVYVETYLQNAQSTNEHWSSPGFYMRRIRWGDVTEYAFPVNLDPSSGPTSVVRSLDRWAPAPNNYYTINNNATHGGYWVLDERTPTLTMFGAIPDATYDGSVVSGTDATPAVNAMIDYVLARAGYDNVFKANLQAIVFGPGKFRIATGVTFMRLSLLARKITIDGTGATFICDGVNHIPFDFIDTEYLRIVNMHGVGNGAPLCFMRFGRLADTNTAARNQIVGCSTRNTAAVPSRWKIAAFINLASEESLFEKNIWENRQTGNVYARANDSINYLLFEDPVEIDAISKANPCVVTTATAHGYSVGDYVVVRPFYGMQQILQRNVAGELSQHTGCFCYVVRAVLSSTTFSLEDFDGNPINSTGWNDYVAVPTKGRVYRQKYPQNKLTSPAAPIFEVSDPRRMSPHERHSMLAVTMVDEVWHAQNGTAGLFQGTAAGVTAIGCFSVSKYGIDLMFAPEGQNFEPPDPEDPEDESTAAHYFDSLRLDVHVEGTAEGFARFRAVANLPHTFINFSNCHVHDNTLRFSVAAFVNESSMEVRFKGGTVTFDRKTSSFTNKLFLPETGWNLFGTLFSIPTVQYINLDTSIEWGASVFDASLGMFWTRLRPFNVSQANGLLATHARRKEGMWIRVTDDVGGQTPAIACRKAGGYKWLRLSDGAEISTT